MLVFKTPELEARLLPLCERALEYFCLPNLKLLCFFDDAEAQGLAKSPKFGDYYCGFHTPVYDNLIRDLPALPDYVSALIFDCETGRWTKDNLIYLRGSTCELPCGAIITFSHELTHFVQMTTKYKVWRANSLLYDNLRSFDPQTTARPWDLPHEHEAQLVSRRLQR